MEVWLALCRMGHADVIARGLIQLHDEGHLDVAATVMGAVEGVFSTEAVQATIQVSLALASSNRSDVMTDVIFSSAACSNLQIENFYVHQAT